MFFNSQEQGILISLIDRSTCPSVFTQTPICAVLKSLVAGNWVIKNIGQAFDRYAKNMPFVYSIIWFIR
jgi:hypothetical protein